MIGIAAMLGVLQGAVPPAYPPSAEAEEIVVIGQRVRTIRARVTSDRQGRLQCRVRRSSGMAELDRAFCEVATRCTAANPRDGAALSACVERDQRAMINAMAAARVRARQQGR